MTFAFDRDYRNREQVRPFMDDYLAIFAEVCRGDFAHNDDFRGRIPGIVGPDEDTAIYLLQNLRQTDALAVRVAEARDAGCVDVGTLDATTKFRRVIRYGWYSGGTGWQEWADARIVPDGRGRPSGVLPKGKRTMGHSLYGGKVMVLA